MDKSINEVCYFRNAEKFPELVTTLRGHTGLVKGVVFDPVGKYLASQSDDKTLRVWKTSDWTQETLIEKPFAEAGATTHVLRWVDVAMTVQTALEILAFSLAFM